ncbi:unnamed protein product, partial [Laminaria digitata]
VLAADRHARSRALTGSLRRENMRSGPVAATTTTLVRHARACRHPAPLASSSSSARFVTNVRARPAPAAASDNGTAATTTAPAGVYFQCKDQQNSRLGYHSASSSSSRNSSGAGGAGGSSRHRWSGVEAVPSR